MESALSPREIQARIRSGESVEDVARVAGVDRERVERFAAPVIAEREHVAGLAMTSSARRRGETSSHRTLRGALNERLLARASTSTPWPGTRTGSTTAAGRSRPTTCRARPRARRSSTSTSPDATRWPATTRAAGCWVTSPPASERSRVLPPATGEHGDDTEPTIDLSDELALVRAIQDVPPAPRAADVPPTVVEVDRGAIRHRRGGAVQPGDEEPPPDGGPAGRGP